MPSFSPRDVHFPEDGQTVIELNHPYVVGSQELQVFLNGVLALTPQDYIETDNMHITFNFQLSKDDVVVTQHMIYYEDKLVHVIGDNAKSLFQRYGEEQRLKPNQRYTATFRYGDKEYEIHFFSPITPMYVPIQTIRADLGKFIEKITDFQIAYMIYNNSIFASTIFEDYFTIDEESGLGVLNTTNGVVPYKVKQFVRYRTEVDLVTQIYLTLMGQSGADHKVLGQLEVEKRFNLGDYKPLLDSLKSELNKYSRTRSPLVTAVKGGSDSYPLTTPRRDFSNTISTGEG